MFVVMMAMWVFDSSLDMAHNLPSFQKATETQAGDSVTLPERSRDSELPMHDDRSSGALV